jgi:hypothetical protein
MAMSEEKGALAKKIYELEEQVGGLRAELLRTRDGLEGKRQDQLKDL